MSTRAGGLRSIQPPLRAPAAGARGRHLHDPLHRRRRRCAEVRLPGGGAARVNVEPPRVKITASPRRCSPPVASSAACRSAIGSASRWRCSPTRRRRRRSPLRSPRSAPAARGARSTQAARAMGPPPGPATNGTGGGRQRLRSRTARGHSGGLRPLRGAAARGHLKVAEAEALVAEGDLEVLAIAVEGACAIWPGFWPSPARSSTASIWSPASARRPSRRHRQRRPAPGRG